MGLGLGDAKAMITFHGGLIWIESRDTDPVLVKSDESTL